MIFKFCAFFLYFFFLALDLFNELDRDTPIVALCVLKGGFQYFNDVLDFLKKYSASQHTKAVQFNIDFIRLKSYTDDRAGNEVQVIGGDNLQSINGKQVIVIEDIVDTGNTMRKLMNVLVKFDPKSVKGMQTKIIFVSQEISIFVKKINFR